MEPGTSVIPPFVLDPLRELKRRLAKRFGPRLADVRLYGSWARGEPRVGSDVDVLVLIHGCTREDVREVSRIEVELMLDLGATFSVQVMSTEELRFLESREVGFALDVQQEGISV
ncbi:MAG: nucleotidyltransferase family protein [Myxococcota bacterium]